MFKFCESCTCKVSLLLSAKKNFELKSFSHSKLGEAMQLRRIDT